VRGTVFARCAGRVGVVAAGVKGEQRKSDRAGECDFFECIHIKTLLKVVMHRAFEKRG
jgi:hypothetical protein